MRIVWMAALGVLLGGQGCARVIHESYVEPKPGHNIQGFVYYESSPYLLVYPDGKGGVSWQILYLPDPTKKRVAKPEAFVAKLETSLSFDKGVLTEANVTADETAFGKALVGAIKTAVGAAFLEGLPTNDTRGGLRPEIFKIIVRGSNIEFWGAEAKEPIIVPS